MLELRADWLTLEQNSLMAELANVDLSHGNLSYEVSRMMLLFIDCCHELYIVVIGSLGNNALTPITVAYCARRRIVF